MSQTTTRQRNYRARLESEKWIGYYLNQIKKESPHNIEKLKMNLEFLENEIITYIKLNKNKGELNET